MFDSDILSARCQSWKVKRRCQFSSRLAKGLFRMTVSDILEALRGSVGNESFL